MRAAPSAARWPSRSAAAAGGRSPATRTRAALPAPGPETAARCRAAACPTVSDARQTTTPPVSLNFATDSHGVRSGVASSSRCGRPRLIATKPASCGSPATARSRWLVRRSKLSPKKLRDRLRRQRGRHLGGCRSTAGTRWPRSPPGPARRRAAAHTVRSTRWRRRWIRSPVATTTARPDISSATPRRRRRGRDRTAPRPDFRAAPARGRRNRRSRAPADRPAAGR